MKTFQYVEKEGYYYCRKFDNSICIMKSEELEVYSKNNSDEIEIKYFIPFYSHDESTKVIKEVLDRVPSYIEFLKLKKEVL